MNNEEYRKNRELYFSIRNDLEKSFEWFEYETVKPIDQLPPYPSQEHLEKMQLLRREKPLWAKIMMVDDYKVLNFNLFEKITQAVKEGEFYVVKADIIRPYEESWFFESLSLGKPITYESRAVLVPKDSKKFPHYGYIRRRNHPNSLELQEFSEDLKELDGFFGNT